MKEKGFAPILIILLVILAGGGYLIYTNYFPKGDSTAVYSNIRTATSKISSEQKSSADTHDWKIYNSVTHRFSIKYPPFLVVKDLMISAPVWESVQFYPLGADMSLPTYVISYETARAVGKQFREIEALAPGKRLFVNDTDYVVKIRNTTIGGYPGIEYLYDATGSNKQGRGSSYAHNLHINKNGALLMFSSSRGSKEEQQKWDPIFVQMIETIKFQ